MIIRKKTTVVNVCVLPVRTAGDVTMENVPQTVEVRRCAY